MSKEERGIKRPSSQTFYSSFLYAALILIFVIGFTPGVAPHLAAQDSCENYVLDFTKEKDVFAAIPTEETFTELTLYFMLKPDFNSFYPQASAIARLYDELPSNVGDIETKHGTFVVFNPSKHPEQVAVRVHKTATDYIEVTSQQINLIDHQWQFVAITYDGRNVGFYQCWPETGACSPEEIIDLGEYVSLRYTGYTILGRWVASWGGLIDKFVMLSKAQNYEQIKQYFACGTIDSSHLFGLYNFDGSQIVKDESDPPNDGFLGLSDEPGKGDPEPLIECFMPAQADIDADGVADACDNCVIPSNPALGYNPDQINRDNDIWGDRCDKCPLTDNTDKDYDGFADPCAVIAQTNTHLEGFYVISTTEFIGLSNINMLVADESTVELVCCKGDCVQEINGVPSIIWDNVVQPNCNFFSRPAVSIYDEDGDGFGTPSGPGVKPVGPGSENNSQEVSFDLNKYYTPEALAEITQCTTYYTNVHGDKGYDPITGECLDDACINPSIAAAQILEGESNPDDTPVSVRIVKLDVKPCSTPSCFGLSGEGVVPVAIHSVVAEDGTVIFDAATINPETIRFGTDPPTNGCSPIPEQTDLIAVPCGTTGPDLAMKDLVLHFDGNCLQICGGVGLNTTILTITGELWDGTSFVGSDDTVCVNNVDKDLSYICGSPQY